MHFLIIDDHPVVREWLKTTLKSSFPDPEFAEAETAREAISLLPIKRWGVIFLDLNLPDRGGLDLLRDIRAIAPDSPVLVFSGRAEGEVGRAALEAGAAGFLPKMSSLNEIRQAINRVIGGKSYVTPDLASTILSRVVTHGDSGPHDILSPRELEVLRLLASGCRPTDIADRLSISVKTVSTYRTRILEKLDLENTAGLVRYAVSHKLIE